MYMCSLIFAALVPALVLSSDLQQGMENCETLPTTIHVTKEESDASGNVIRVCEGDVVVSKCDGVCWSRLQPSVLAATGFIKECVCCRETWMEKREVILTSCFDTDGKRFTDDMGTMTITMQEPRDCKCYKCGV